MVTVSTEPGPVQLQPALQIRTDMTAAQFDALIPSGADILIVPAMHQADNPALLKWVRAQSSKGAMVVSICDGAWVLAHAGLLEGKTATTHWYSLKPIGKAFPGTTWVDNQRYVVDGHVMTTTGITASIPASLALVEAIADRHTAEVTAQRLGVTTWGAAHDTSAFTLTTGRMLVAATNWLAVWRHETIEIAVEEGFDEMSVALTADAWSRTYRSQALATNGSGAVLSRRGLLLEADAKPHPGRYVPPAHRGTPTTALNATLDDITGRYGASTADFVALQLEYPRR